MLCPRADKAKEKYDLNKPDYNPGASKDVKNMIGAILLIWVFLSKFVPRIINVLAQS